MIERGQMSPLATNVCEIATAALADGRDNGIRDAAKWLRMRGKEAAAIEMLKAFGLYDASATRPPARGSE